MAVLDSCGVGHLGSHLLIAGIGACGRTALAGSDPETVLSTANSLLTAERPVIFTLSYDLGRKMAAVRPGKDAGTEPDLFALEFDTLIVHDYSSGKTALYGRPETFDDIEQCVLRPPEPVPAEVEHKASAASNVTEAKYIKAVEEIQELIRDGRTYQTNLTQQFTVASGIDPCSVFRRLRHDHPAPFAAFIGRGDSTVVSASPERFFRVEGDKITTSPIKGTRRRGRDRAEDDALRSELLASEKDRLRNDDHGPAAKRPRPHLRIRERQGRKAV